MKRNSYYVHYISDCMAQDSTAEFSLEDIKTVGKTIVDNMQIFMHS